MPRPVTLFTGQWADLPLEALCKKAKSFGYDGLELACWGDHFSPQQALEEDSYCKEKWDLLQDHGLLSFAISNHLAGQAVCDKIDERHEGILPPHVWGDGDPEGVRQRAAKEMIATGRAARRFFDAAPEKVKARLKQIGRTVVVGFTGSRIWDTAYAFPPLPSGSIAAGFQDFADRWTPILDDYREHNVCFALEVHPTEIAFDIASTRRALEAIGNHPAFGLNFDPSHFGYQRVDYLGFLREFGSRLFNVHIKDVWWSENPAEAGVFGGHTDFGTDGRSWDFRSPGRGRIDFESIVRILNHVGYEGPLSVEWEDPMMDREHGATEAAAFVRQLDFPQSNVAFDAAFGE
ncbi:MAG: sugar phosphate isomerase/epimerase [Planctomycetota bacterium]|nr:sugar phosphate isomerase/epimerase [Planctomycetota bacterium]